MNNVTNVCRNMRDWVVVDFLHFSLIMLPCSAIGLLWIFGSRGLLQLFVQPYASLTTHPHGLRSLTNDSFLLYFLLWTMRCFLLPGWLLQMEGCSSRGSSHHWVWDFILHSSSFSYMFMTPCIYRLYLAFSQVSSGIALIE